SGPAGSWSTDCPVGLASRVQIWSAGSRPETRSHPPRCGLPVGASATVTSTSPSSPSRFHHPTHGPHRLSAPGFPPPPQGLAFIQCKTDPVDSLDDTRPLRREKVGL